MTSKCDSSRVSRAKGAKVYHNGFYERDWVTPFGAIRLRIAHTRGRASRRTKRLRLTRSLDEACSSYTPPTGRMNRPACSWTESVCGWGERLIASSCAHVRSSWGGHRRCPGIHEAENRRHARQAFRQFQKTGWPPTTVSSASLSETCRSYSEVVGYFWKEPLPDQERVTLGFESKGRCRTRRPWCPLRLEPYSYYRRNEQ